MANTAHRPPTPSAGRAGPAAPWLLGLSGWLSAATAQASPPSAAATLDPSGAYTLVLNVQQAWLSAEISVAGGETVELGATPVGAVLELEGSTTATGPLWIVVRAAIDDEDGVTWTFSVDPQHLPAPQPALEGRLPPRARGRDGRWRE